MNVVNDSQTWMMMVMVFKYGKRKKLRSKEMETSQNREKR